MRVEVEKEKYAQGKDSQDDGKEDWLRYGGEWVREGEGFEEDDDSKQSKEGCHCGQDCGEEVLFGGLGYLCCPKGFCVCFKHGVSPAGSVF